jgi:hypothetical protein
MNLLSKQNIPPAGRDETIFRLSFWGALFSFFLVFAGFLGGAVLFVASYRLASIGGMILAGLYCLLLAWLCSVIFHTLQAMRSPANWLARIGPGGILLKYRSYLHADSPEEDPIVLQLAWAEIAAAQLHEEIHTSEDSDGTSRIKRWFLAIRLDPRFLDIEQIRAALTFEQQRQPAHFKIDDLKHELFLARKKRATAAEITRIEEEIARAKRLHPGRQRKMKFHDRPIVFSPPDQLKMEWTHITPGKKKLRQLLARHTIVSADREESFDRVQPLPEPEFEALLATLLSREEKIEAIKLVKLQSGLDTTAAIAFIDRSRK